MRNKTLPINLTVNSEIYELDVETQWTLAYVLREIIRLTGTKLMCDEGECGSCTVLINGVPVLSCLMLAIECAGKSIMTIEGLSDPSTGNLHPLQKAFIEGSAMQCGVCTPGILMTAKSLLDKNCRPTDDEVREALAGNLCRCGNYKRITECVLAAAKMMNGGA